jgi:hypothetical protein
LQTFVKFPPAFHSYYAMPSTPISCLTLGKERHLGEAVAARLADHNYAVVAILDEGSITPANVGIVSRALLPRPKALLVGGALPDEEAESCIRAWEEYVKEVGLEGTAVIRVGPDVMRQVGPAGVTNWLVGELDSKFK